MTEQLVDHAFFSHDTSTDTQGRENTDCVRFVYEVCKKSGLRIWFDEDRLAGDQNNLERVCAGIDSSAVVVVFITQSYINKVCDSRNDVCKMEFTHALKKRRPPMMVSVLLEECVRDPNTWRGPVGMALGNHAHIDMSCGTQPRESKCAELVRAIKAIIKRNEGSMAMSSLQEELKGIDLSQNIVPLSPSSSPAPAATVTPPLTPTAQAPASTPALPTSTPPLPTTTTPATTTPPPAPQSSPNHNHHILPARSSAVGTPHTILFTDTKYVGKIISGTAAHGTGEFQCTAGKAKGNRYIGEFSGTVPDGKGKFLFADGEVYEGEYRNGRKNGQGTYHFNSGARYSGGYLDGKKHGYGVHMSKEGDVYQGEYRQGVKHGYGVMKYKSSDKYEGEYAHDKKHGKGKYSFVDGSVYEGEYKDDVKNGQGKYVWPNGDVYEGGYSNGNKHGYGAMRYASGRVQLGHWNDGEFKQ